MTGAPEPLQELLVNLFHDAHGPAYSRPLPARAAYLRARRGQAGTLEQLHRQLMIIDGSVSCRARRPRPRTLPARAAIEIHAQPWFDAAPTAPGAAAGVAHRPRH
jgi:hypothetical protein